MLRAINCLMKLHQPLRRQWIKSLLIQSLELFHLQQFLECNLKCHSFATLLTKTSANACCRRN